MLDPKVHINLSDFYYDLIALREEANVLIYIYDFDTRNFLFQGNPTVDTEEWKEIIQQHKFDRVNCIEWGLTYTRIPYLCININSTRR